VGLGSSSVATSRSARRGAFTFPFRLIFAIALLLSTFGGVFGALTPSALAATITFNVDSTTDAVNVGACATAIPTQCTLREAIIEANALSAATDVVINLNAGATYILTLIGPGEDDSTTGDLDIKSNVTINGKGTGTGPGAIIQGNDPTNQNLTLDQEDRVFQAFGGYTVVFNDLTVEDGYAFQANGGGILHDGGKVTGGTLTLNNVTVTDNDTGSNAQDNPGAGIYNGADRTLTLNNSTVSNNGQNTTSNPGDGGGVYNAGIATLINSTVNGNTAGSGGGIYNIGELSLTGGIVSNNTTFGGNGGFFGSGGGGVFNGGSASIVGARISGNSGIVGGGLANSAITTPPGMVSVAQVVPGTLTLSNTVVNANTSLLFGGGVFNAQGTFSMTGGALRNNTATGFVLFGGFGGQGGGLLNLATAILTNTTLESNSASNLLGYNPIFGGGVNAANGNGGGVGNAGVLNVSGTTFSGNSVAGPGSGGALFNGPRFFSALAARAGLRTGASAASIDTVATLTNSTLSGNVTTNGGAAILNDDNSTVNLINVTIANNQSGILNRTGETNPNGVVAVQNSIIANNPDYNCSGAITNGGYNIDSAATCAFGTGAGSLSNTDPQLGPLALNAPGTTQTHALASTSPAIDKIPTAGANCPATDQRGVNRPQGAACDIGAYEVVPPPTYPVINYTVALSVSGNGSVAPGPGNYTSQAGSTQSFTATPASGNVFIGWTVDGTFVGFGNPLDLPVTKNRTVVATFAAIPAFCDVTPDTPGALAINQLAARGVIFGSDNPNGPGKCFLPTDTLLRIHVAGMVARAYGWDKEDHGNSFTDKGSVDNDLWRNAGTLAFYNVALGYRDGSYDPTGPVLHAQAVSFTTRAMIRKGYWTLQEDNAAYYTAVPMSSGHRQDAVTYHFYAGNILGTSAPTDPWNGPTGYDQPSTRTYFAQVLWQAYSSYFSVNHIP
jgi:CSLREA domain-containing protein